VTTSSMSGPMDRSADPLESALADLLSRRPPDALLARLDERIGRAVAAPQARSARRPRRIGRRPVALLVAAAVLAGAGAPLGFYDGLGAGFDYGFSIQLARSVAVGATAVDDGFRVTIDRAYLDGERLMLAVRVTDELKRSEVNQLMAMYSVVSDENGVWPGAGVATSHPIGRWSATNIQWRLAPAPLPRGSHRLRVEIPHIFWHDPALPSGDDNWPWHRQAGEWSFDIELPVDGGATVVRPGTAIDVDGVRVTLDEVVVGGSAIRVTLGNDDRATWSAVGSIRRGGEAYPFVVQAVGEPGVMALQADGGTDDPSGAWTIVIDAFDRDVGGREQRISGPWEFAVTVP
jgi:hypothetical protein